MNMKLTTIINSLLRKKPPPDATPAAGGPEPEPPWEDAASTPEPEPLAGEPQEEAPPEGTPPDESPSPDTVFPEPEAKPSVAPRRSSFLKKLIYAGLLVTAFAMGQATRPELIDQTRVTLQNWSVTLQKVSAPWIETAQEKVMALIDSVQPGATPSGGGESSADSGVKRKIKYWRGPMNPNYISDKPGKSPMGMDLIPVYEDEVSGVVKINPTVVQNIGVKTEVVRKRNLQREIRTVARLTYDERLVNHIHTKYGGWIEKLHVDFTGQEVSQDELLLEIYSPDLVSTQEELVLALRYQESLVNSPFSEIRNGAKRLLESTKTRLELFDVPEHQIRELMKTGKIRKTMHIHSPVRGFVVHKTALQGMFVEPGKPLYTIADLSNIWVLADIYEYEIPWVALGQDAEMTLAYFPGKVFKGKVTFIDPFLDKETRTLKVRMEFSNPDWNLKPEMYANVVLKSEIIHKGVAVPEAAVIRSGESSIVIVQLPGGGFQPRRVVLGTEAEGYFQVLKGVRSERVVTSSNFLIDSESKLMEAVQKLTTAKPVKSKGPKKKVILKEAPAKRNP
ncbi:MAG: efflux RND transporter periplasmic adaptor subunit [Nitrospinaceae bacterium]